MGSIIRMSGALAGGTENAIAQIDVPANTTLLGIQWAVNANLDADDEFYRVQLSFRASYSYTNDDRAVISEVAQQVALLTSGVYINQNNLYVPMPDIGLMGGERLFLHGSSTSGVIANVVCFLHLDHDMDKPSVRRR